MYAFVQHFQPASITLVLLILVVSWFTVIAPGFARLREAHKEFNQLSQIKNDVELEVGQIERINNIVSSISAGELQRIERSMPSVIDYPTLWLFFSGLAEENNVDLLSIEIIPTGKVVQLKNPIGTTQVEKIQVELETASGGYSTLRGMMKSIEEVLPIADVTEFQFKPTNDRLRVKLMLFVLSEDVEPLE